MKLTHFPLILVCALVAACSTAPAQDTSTNRLASALDAQTWPNSVAEGDYLIFRGNDDYKGPNGEPLSIYAIANMGMDIQLPLGKKICIYRGTYRRIILDGINCASTEQTPTIVTNFGGQVQWGNNPDSDNHRTFELKNFRHLLLTGEYNTAKKTGDPNYLGHNNGLALGSGNYYEKYGFWGNQRWSAERQPVTSCNGVRIYGFDTCKVRYVAVWGGGFAGFNIKTDSPAVPVRVSTDIQDCFAGFTEGEGFYISNSGGAAGQNLTKLTLRNNIVVCSGAEALQTDNLVEGSIVENNVVFGAARFFRRPFKSAGGVSGDQEGTHQFSFVEGGITVQNNILAGGVGQMQGVRYYNPGLDAGGLPRANPSASKHVVIRNNYIGQGHSHMSYFWQGDGITPYDLIDNIYGRLSNPVTNDAYLNPTEPVAALDIFNSNNLVTLTNNQFSLDRSPYMRKSGTPASLTVASGTTTREPALLKFKNIGFSDDFDLRRLTVWSATFGSETGKPGQYIPYKKDDVVFYWDSTGGTRFYQCKVDHQSSATITYDPNTATAQWMALTWNSRTMPPLDVRLKPNTVYNHRGMGLTYNESNTITPDYTAPVITLVGRDMSVAKQKPFVEPGFSAQDNRDGDLTAQLAPTWVGPTVNVNILGEYYRSYRVVDAAGNVSDPVVRVVTVSGMSVSVSRRVQLNFHRNAPVTLSGWVNLGNNTTGLVDSAATLTNLFDVNNTDTGWDLLIDDIDAGYSEHYGIETNSAGRAIVDFPAVMTKQGIKIRDTFEDPCVFRLTGLNPAKFYDVRYTGYIAAAGANGAAKADLVEPVSGRKDSVQVKDNLSDVGELRSLKPNASGVLDLKFTTETPLGQPNISGLILQEKSDFGYINPVSEWRLDEASGTVAADSMGLAGGTLAGNANWTTAGRFNRGITLDGTGDWISIPTQTQYSGGALSVSFWVKPAVLDGTVRGLISKRIGAGNGVAFSIYLGAGNRLFVDLGKTGGASQYDTGYTFAGSNVWYHVVVVFNGSASSGRLRAWVNGGAPRYEGQPVETTIPNTTAPLLIGSLDAASAVSCQGIIDQVKLYNKALSQTDIDLLNSY